MKIRWTIIGLLMIWVTAGTASGRQVKVEEIALSLYNKPVTGYRVLLDRSQRVVTNQILKHIAAADETKPFQFERTIIYENIRYTPITEARDISLHFLMRNLQGQYTEITLVAMYDYKRSISSRDFPELSLRLQVDLAQLVRRTTGDILESDQLVFDDKTIKELQIGEAPEAPTEDGNVVEHFQEEEVENHGVLIHKDPFEQETTPQPRKQQPIVTTGGNTDSTVRQLAARIRVLEAREQTLLANEKSMRRESDLMKRRQEQLQSKLKQNKQLRDSIVILNRRVESMIGQHYVADDISVSSETATEIRKLESQRNRYERRIERLEAENDSLGGKAAKMWAQLQDMASTRSKDVRRLDTLRQENRTLQSAIAELQTDNRRMRLLASEKDQKMLDSLLFVLNSAQARNVDAQTAYEKLEKKHNALEQDFDLLNDQRIQLEKRISTLENENRDLQVQPVEVVRTNEGFNVDSMLTVVRAERTAVRALNNKLVGLEGEKAQLEDGNEQLSASNKSLRSEITRLEGEIARLRKQQGSTLATSGSDNVIRDSLRKLSQRLGYLETQASEAEALKAKLDKRDDELRLKEQQFRKLNTEKNALQARFKENQRLQKKLETNLQSTEKQLSDTRQALQSASARREQLEEDNLEMRSRLETLEAGLGTDADQVQALSDSISQLNRDRAALNRTLSQRNGQMRKAVQVRDSLKSALRTERDRRKDYTRQIVQLESRIDSLQSSFVPAEEQSDFIKEQWARLQKWEKELQDREAKTSDREKLSATRNANLEERLADLEKREARVADLEKREKAVALREQQLDAQAGLASETSVVEDLKRMREGRVVEFGQTVPVFIVETNLSYKAAQKKVVGYMLSRDALLDEQFPDIFYRSVRLPEIAERPIALKVRINTQGLGSILQISFMLEEDIYLGEQGSKRQKEAAKQLIGRMLRYKH